MLARSLKRTPMYAAALLAVTALTAPAADPAMLNQLMPDARVVFGIDLDAAKTSPLVTHLLSRLQTEDSDFQSFIAATGFDPRRDVNELVVGSVGEKGRKTGVVIARGNFQVSKLIAMAQSHKQTVTNYQGTGIIIGSGEAHQGNTARQPVWIAFPSATRAIIGDETSVKGVLDRAGANGLKAELVARAQEVSSRYHVWFVSTVPVAEFTAGASPSPSGTARPRPELFQAVEQVSGGVQLGSSVEIGVDALTRSDRDAQALSDVVKFMAGMIQMNEEKPGAALPAKLLASMDTRIEGPTVRFSLSIPEEDLEKLMQQQQQQQRSRPARKRLER